MARPSASVTAKITELTPEQEASLPRFRDEWLKIGLSCEPMDKDAAKLAIAKVYACAGLTPPEVVIFLRSPLEGAIAAAMLSGKFKAQVGDQVGDQVWDQVRDQVRAQVYRAGYGSHDASWLGFMSFFREHFGLAAKVEGLSDLARTSGWFWPFDKLAIVTDRPEKISFDEQRRAHSETGPAILYRDGFAVHAWHGRRVPAAWIEQRSTLDPAEIVRHENVEMRAVGAEIVGWPRMLAELGCRVVEQGASADVGDLIELTLPGLPEPGRFLRAACPRNGLIVEGVPRRSEIDGKPIDTALAAQAWRVGLSQAEYRHPTHRT